MRYAHTNLVAKDWKKLAQFYIDVFDCIPKPPERNYTGDWLDKALDLKNCTLKGIHLILPGYSTKDAPTLEIYQYIPETDLIESCSDTLGFTHIAFEVEDVLKKAKEIIKNGGTTVGVLTTRQVPAGALTFQYLKDPEGNIVEIQSWS
jgi:predicted enzyme related to lactoylglutathione lyase